MRAKIVFTCLLWTLLNIKPGDGATNTFISPTLPNGRQCFCPGDVETYTCTVVGGGGTVWSGTAFDCPSSNIQLLHDRYSQGDAVGDCGTISGNGTSVDTNGTQMCYTSELSVTINANMDGQTVMCSTSSNTMIGSDLLRVAGPPPTPTNVAVTEVVMSTFTVSWTELTSDCGTSFSYEVISDGCGGSCSVSSSTSGVCSGWTAGQTCSVMVRVNSALCGGQTGSFSTPVMLNLTEPSPPAAGDVSVLAVYSDDSLDSIMVVFPTVSPVEVAPGFSPAVIYSVRTVSDPQMVLTGNCNATLCQYLTNFTSDNPPSNNFTVTITVSNGIGGGQSVITSSQPPINISSLVTLTVVVMDSNATVSANLSSGFRGSTGLTVTYGITPNCDANTVMSASNGMAGDTLEVILASLQPNLTYCYSIYLTQGELSFKVVGVFRSGYFVIPPEIPPENPSLVIVVIIICAVVLSFAIGIIVGILLTHFCGIGVQGIRQRKSGTLLLVILLIIVFGLGIGILIGYCCVKNKKEKDDKKHLESQEINPPPPADSLYADPNSIEHEAAPGTEDQYAMVDRKVKKNTKPKPTPPEALYQDPNTIEHKTAASGDTYAVVDKPKRSSKKKGGPDVVPPASEGLTYADIDLSSKRPKPGSGRQAPQQPGEYPKEHPVEYSSVDHGNTSQL